MICCPFHGESKPSFGICIEGDKKGLFQCLSTNCNEKGTFFSLIAFLDGISLRKAIENYKIGFDAKKIKNLELFLYRNLLNSNNGNKIKILNNNILKKYKNPSGKYLKYILEERKLKKSTIKKWNILSCTKGIWNGRVIIPIYNENNKLVSLAARSINKNIDKRYKIRKMKNTDRSKILFGLNHIENKKKLYLVEGEFDVIYLQRFDIPAVSLGTTSISEYQLKKIAKYCEEVVINLDGDVDIEKIKEKRRQLKKYVKVKILKLPGKKDPNDLTKKEIKQIYFGGK